MEPPNSDIFNIIGKANREVTGCFESKVLPVV